MSDLRVQELLRELQDRWGADGTRYAIGCARADLGLILNVLDNLPTRAMGYALREIGLPDGAADQAIRRVRRAVEAK